MSWAQRPKAPQVLRKPLSFLAAILLLACSFTALAAAESAAAHDSLLSSSPADGETVTDELSQITLTFTNTPMAGVEHIIQVTDPTGTIVSNGETVISGNDLTTKFVPAREGAHEVAWQAVSVDGHTISGEFVFTYAGPLTAEVIPSSAPETSTAAPDHSPSSVDADENGSEGAGASPIWAGLAVLLIVVIVTGVILRRASNNSGAARADLR